VHEQIRLSFYELLLSHGLRLCAKVFNLPLFSFFSLSDFIVCFALANLFILLACLQYAIRCFNFTIHLIITEERSKCYLLPFIFIVESGSKLNVLDQQKIDFFSFEVKNASLFFVVASLTLARNLI